MPDRPDAPTTLSIPLADAVQADLAAVETRRRAAIMAIAASVAGGALLIAVWLPWVMTMRFSSGTDPRFLTSMAALVVPLAALVVLALQARRGYARAFKAVVVPQLLRAIAPGLRYQPDETLPGEVFEGALIAAGALQRKVVSDLVQGRVDDVPVRAAHIRALQGGSEVTFDGVFAEFRLPRRVDGHVVLIAGKGAESYGLAGKAYMLVEARRPRGLPVAFEGEEIGGFYGVYASDEAVARRTLTPRLRKLVCDLAYAQPMGRRASFSFVGDHAYVAMPWSGWLEPPLLAGAGSPRALACIAENVRGLVALIHSLNQALGDR